MSEITQNDVMTLYDDASPARRSVLAQKIGHDLKAGDLSETEHELALAICQKLAEDVDLTVRSTLANAIKNSQAIPKELALQMAHDVDEVSLPILEFSSLLEDKDLIAIVREGKINQQLAITQRKSISPVLSHTLVEEGNEQVVASLLQNEGADIADETYNEVIERFTHSPNIHSSLAKRHNLPQHVIERMVDLVSEQLKSYLIAHHQVSALALEQLVLESREDAKRRLLSDPLSKRDAKRLVESLARKDKLTAELIFRALEIGDRPFFEFALAQRVGIDVNAARTLIKDPGERGFRALYDKAGLPKQDYKAINYLVENEYRNKRHAPITNPSEFSPHSQEPESWLTETDKKQKKWRLF